MAGNTWFINVKSKGIKKTNKDVKKLKGNMGGLNKTVRNLAIGFGGLYLGKALLGAARGAIKTAGEFESLRIRLNNMYGSVQRGGQAFDEFNKIAATTPFQLKNVVEAGASLKAFGVDAENMIKPVSDLAAFMGVDVVEAAQAMGRAFAGGAGAADVLRDRGILQLIKDSQGIKDLSRLTIPEFRDVMVKALTDPSTGIVGATDKLAKSWEGTVSNFKDGVERLKAAIGEALIVKLKPLVLKINTTLSDMGEIGWEFIGEAFLNNWKVILGQLAGIFAQTGLLIGKAIIDGMISGISSHTGWDKFKMAFKLTHPTMFLDDFFKRSGKDTGFSFVDEITKAIEDFTFDLSGLVTNLQKEAQEIKDANPLKDIFDPEIDADEPMFDFANWDEELEKFKSIKEAELAIYIASLKSQTDAFLEAGVLEVDINKWKDEQIAQFHEDSNKKITDADAKLLKAKHKNAQDQFKVAGDLAGSLASLHSSAKGSAKVTAGLQAIQATINMIATMQSAVAPPPIGYGWTPLGWAASAAAAASGVANVLEIKNSMKKMATGGSFVTSGEETIMVGDNPSGRELVNVTPLDAAGEPTNSAGGVNVTFTGNVMSEQFIEEQAIPQIKEAIRRGADIGIG